MICRMNFIHCEYANSNGYCCLSACCNPNIVGNTIKNEEPKVYSQQYVDELKAKYGWHTGTPTEEGWYLLALTTKVFNDNPFCVAYMDGNRWLGIDDFFIYVDHVLAWQKIEHFDASN